MSVFVIQRPIPNSRGWQPDLSPATEFGELKFVFEGSDRVYALPGPMLHKARRELKDFNPAQDYILWPASGDPAAIYLVMAALMEKNPDSLSFLYWNRKREQNGERAGAGFYVEYKVDLKGNKNHE